SEMSVTDLSRYTSEFLENLTDDIRHEGVFEKNSNLPVSRIVVTKLPKSSEEEIIREKAKRILQNRYGFSEGQVDNLFSIQKNVQPKSKTTHEVPCSTVNIVISKRQSLLSSKDRARQETIGEMAHRFLRDKLSIRDIRAEAYALALSAKNANADFTEEANKIQRDNQKKAEANRIDYPDEFTLESVKERLDSYDTTTLPDLQALADNRGQPDIPRKFKKYQERAKELLTWVQNAISSGRMGDPGKPGVKWFNRFLKNMIQFPNTYENWCHLWCGSA
ncbi:2289_t:CDS:2, partial [Paraglomus occultum]